MDPLSLRTDWTVEEISDLFSLPFMELLYQAHSIHRAYFDTNTIQLSALLSIKTGACPENCSYCPQSGHFKTHVKKQKLLDLHTVKTRAIEAKSQGASRFCMGAAWRSPPQNVMPQIINIIREIKALDLEVCMTLGMLTEAQATAMSKAGLDYYNHNLDTSPEYYPEIVTTRTYEERLKTLEIVRTSGIKVCCGGIMGMGEERCDKCVLAFRDLCNTSMCYKRSRKSGQLFYAGRPRRAKLRNALQMTLRRIVYLSCLYCVAQKILRLPATTRLTLKCSMPRGVGSVFCNNWQICQNIRKVCQSIV